MPLRAFGRVCRLTPAQARSEGTLPRLATPGAQITHWVTQFTPHSADAERPHQCGGMTAREARFIPSRIVRPSDFLFSQLQWTLKPGNVPVSAELSADTCEHANLLKPESLVQRDGRGIGQTHASDDAMNIFAGHRLE